MKHNHLCRDCGAILYTCAWCDKAEDHRISGRCEKCWGRIGEVWVLRFTHAYGTSIMRAEHVHDEHLADWCKFLLLSRTSKPIELPHIKWGDVPKRIIDGVFLGCENEVWILSDEERQYFLDLETSRVEEEKAKKEADKRAYEEGRAAKFAEAARTGKPVLLYRWFSDCCEHGKIDCDWDVNRQYAMPDGTIKTECVHMY